MPWFVKIEEGIVDKLHLRSDMSPPRLAFVQESKTSTSCSNRLLEAERRWNAAVLFPALIVGAKEIVARDPLVANCCVHYKCATERHV
jgi:hypothetical protein